MMPLIFEVVFFDTRNNVPFDEVTPSITTLEVLSTDVLELEVFSFK